MVSNRGGKFSLPFGIMLLLHTHPYGAEPLPSDLDRATARKIAAPNCVVTATEVKCALRTAESFPAIFQGGSSRGLSLPFAPSVPLLGISPSNPDVSRRPLMNSSILKIVETRYHLRPLTARDQNAQATCWTSWILSKHHCLLLVLQPRQCPCHGNFTESPHCEQQGGPWVQAVRRVICPPAIGAGLAEIGLIFASFRRSFSIFFCSWETGRLVPGIFIIFSRDPWAA